MNANPAAAVLPTPRILNTVLLFPSWGLTLLQKLPRREIRTCIAKRQIRLVNALKTYRSTPKAKTVLDAYSCPGFTIVVGKFALFGESGKCCVSRQKPLRRGYASPLLPVSFPSRKLPV